MTGLPAPLHIAPIFAALGDPYRLSIVARLCEHGPLPTTRLREGSEAVTRQGFTKHLQVLEQAGLLESHRIGRHRQWQLRRERIGQMCDYLRLVSVQWEVRLERLKALVEEPDG